MYVYFDYALLVYICMLSCAIGQSDIMICICTNLDCVITLTRPDQLCSAGVLCRWSAGDAGQSPQ